MRLLDNADVEAVLSMHEGIEALRHGYADLSRGDAAYVPRIDLYAPTGREEDYYQWGSMAGVCRSYGVAAVRMKSDVVSWPEGRTQEKYCVRPGRYCGLILLFSIVDGAPLAIIQDGFLQHIRVGAAAGIGVDALAREDARELGLIGSGGMAATFLDAIADVRHLTRVLVYSPTKEHRNAFVEAARHRHRFEIVGVGSAEEAVSGADIVATATDSMAPTFDPAWLAPGTHVVCVTRRELSDELIQRSDIVVQLGVNTIPFGTPVPGMEWKAGGIAAYVSGKAGERSRIPSSKQREVGAFPTLSMLYRGDIPGRMSPEEVSLLVNTGTQGLQFASVGGRVLQLAEERNLGRVIPTEWFLQDIRD